MRNRIIILVGCGNMGRAMLEGWLASDVLNAKDVHVVEPNDDLRNRAAALRVNVLSSAAELREGIDPALIVFAVKPQVMFDVTTDYVRFNDGRTAFLSVAAGIRTAKFEEVFGKKAGIIRVMPNTPAAISKGMMVIFNNANVTPEQRSFVEALMASSGVVTTINDEALMDAVTAVSGSGPAYLFHMIEALRTAGEAAGLDSATAKILAAQTIYGAACYAKQSELEPGTLREQVTSPNGTTQAALEVLMNDNALTKLLTAAVAAAKKRSEELAT